MTRSELRDLVFTLWQASEKSWPVTGLAFSRLAPHILVELDKPEPPLNPTSSGYQAIDWADTDHTLRCADFTPAPAAVRGPR